MKTCQKYLGESTLQLTSHPVCEESTGAAENLNQVQICGSGKDTSTDDDKPPAYSEVVSEPPYLYHQPVNAQEDTDRCDTSLPPPPYQTLSSENMLPISAYSNQVGFQHQRDHSVRPSIASIPQL